MWKTLPLGKLFAFRTATEMTMTYDNDSALISSSEALSALWITHKIGLRDLCPTIIWIFRASSGNNVRSGYIRNFLLRPCMPFMLIRCRGAHAQCRALVQNHHVNEHHACMVKASENNRIKKIVPTWRRRSRLFLKTLASAKACWRLAKGQLVNTCSGIPLTWGRAIDKRVCGEWRWKQSHAI